MPSQSERPEEASPTFNLFRRLPRPIGRSASSSNINPNDVDAFPDVMDSSTSTSSLNLSKLTPFKRLKTQLGKRRRSSKEKGKAVERSPPQTPDPTLESPESNETIDVAGPSQTIGSFDYGTDCTSGEVDPDKKESGEHDNRNHNVDDVSQTISPTTLAHRIHSLLSPFPSHFTLSPSGSFLTPHTAKQCGEGESVTADSTLFSLLSSVSAMNGSISKGRESVWAALERLRYFPHQHPKQECREHVENNSNRSHDHETVPDNVEMSSVMICCPLQPTEDTEVEIARSEVVSIDFEGSFQELAPVEDLEQPKVQGIGMIRWPFRTGKGRADTVPVVDEVLPPPSPKQTEVRVWYPSRIKVSLQAFWWGYRIYLPPPVMRVLSDKSLEAAKRAAMITAALTWLVSHIPTTMLPPPMRPVVEIVKQIVPIMSYVGGFIAWSWNTIQSFDKGQGVTLSATWLLPIALVPGTWFYTEPLISPSSAEPSRT